MSSVMWSDNNRMESRDVTVSKTLDFMTYRRVGSLCESEQGQQECLTSIRSIVGTWDPRARRTSRSAAPGSTSTFSEADLSQPRLGARIRDARRTGSPKSRRPKCLPASDVWQCPSDV